MSPAALAAAGILLKTRLFRHSFRRSHSKMVAAPAGGVTLEVGGSPIPQKTSTPMSRLYFGGSFNPIHFGHLRCAAAVAAKMGFDQVVLIPAATPPHKPEAADLASASDRLAMCRLA